MSKVTIALNPNTFTTAASNKHYYYLTAGPSNGPLLFFLHGWPGIATTWKAQLHSFASLGFSVVAPDMAGYGKSWTSDDSSEWALEKLVPDLIELLHHLGRKEAVWIGHDWGSGPLFAIASHHPEVVRAIVSISVAYRTLELGLPPVLETIDRKLYPEDEYPYGQWDYQIFYEEEPKALDRQFESNLPAYLKLVFGKGSAAAGRGVARTAQVRKNKGWFGGPNAPIYDMPMERVTLDQEVLDELVAGFEKNGFKGATAWYLNHAANRKYTLEKSVNDGILKMPVLFIHTEYDAVCQTISNPGLMAPMREYCHDLTEISVKAGHWGQIECPEEVNSGIAGWIVKSVSDWWPAPEPLKSRI